MSEKDILKKFLHHEYKKMSTLKKIILKKDKTQGLLIRKQEAEAHFMILSNL